MNSIKVVLLFVMLAAPTVWAQDTDEPVTQESQSTEEETTPAVEEKPDFNSRPNDSDWRFSAGLGYIISTPDATFSEASYSDSTDSITGEARLEYGQAFSLYVEGRKLPRHSWGFLGGLRYEGEREFEGGSLSGGGYIVNYTGGSGASKVQFTTFYVNAVYRWNTFYIPFGLNFSAAKFKPANGFTGTHSESGSLGGQLGVGWELDEHFAVELYSWVTSMELKSTTSTSTLNYGTGMFPSLVLIGKYIF